ncbi:hypothetical protein BJY00DRAFT_314917 [Aspergillus carlsbadensis]|nr:hypothetical protein BJY00DRAFT_314917 [Aspergillus carlsbadensis]
MSTLFQHKVKPDEDESGYTDLHLAVHNSDVVVWKMLLDYWKDKGYQLFNHAFDENPVHTAAESGDLECLKLLQAAGLDIDCSDPLLAITTLHCACRCKLPRGADVDVVRRRLCRKS